MSPRRFAEFAQVSKATVLHWIRKGELPATKVRTERGPGYEIEMDEIDAMAWLEERRKPVANDEQAAFVRQWLTAHKALLATPEAKEFIRLRELGRRYGLLGGLDGNEIMVRRP